MLMCVAVFNYTGSALHIAADVGNFKIAKFLVSKGADVDVKNRNGKTSHDIAKGSRNSDIVEYLSDLK